VKGGKPEKQRKTLVARGRTNYHYQLLLLMLIYMLNKLIPHGPEPLYSPSYNTVNFKKIIMA
jgi:hypothetical protein